MFSAFIKCFFLSSIVGLSLIVLLNYLVDPYDIFSSKPIDGLNHPKSHDNTRRAVAMRIIKYKPKTIVLGTSRVAGGFSHNDLREYSNNDSFLNAGILGVDFHEIYTYFKHAIHVQPDLKTVILGIDLFSFNENRKPQPDFEFERLEKNSYNFNDVKHSLLNYKSCYNSLECLFRNIFNHPMRSEILTLGEANYLKWMLSTHENYKNYQLDRLKISMFRDLVEICKAKSINLKVLICPVKAMYWNFYWENGLWQNLDNLKRELCSIHPIWDFSGFNPITSETLECDGEALYYECSHFTPYVGSLLLKRMYGLPSSIDSIGYLLMPETVEVDLANIHAQRYFWLQDRIITP